MLKIEKPRGNCPGNFNVKLLNRYELVTASHAAATRMLSLLVVVL